MSPNVPKYHRFGTLSDFEIRFWVYRIQKKNETEIYIFRPRVIFEIRSIFVRLNDVIREL